MKRKARDELPNQPPKKKRKRKSYRKSKKNKLRYRSPNSYLIYRHEFYDNCVKHNQDLKDNGEPDVLKYKCVDKNGHINQGNISTESARNWRVFSEEDKKPYTVQATLQKKQHFQVMKTSYESQSISRLVKIRKCHEELQKIYKSISTIHQYLFAYERFNGSSTSEIKQPKIRKRRKRKRKPQSKSESSSGSGSVESESDSEDDE